MGQEYNIALEGRAYLLRPDTPTEGKARALKPGENESELAEPLRSQASEAGLTMRPPPITPNSMYVLQATEHAQQQGKFLEFHQAAYRAFWGEGKDLGDLAVIGEIAEGVGLDSVELVTRLEQQHYASTVIGQYEEALSYGIRGIPTFLVGNLLFTGAHPYSVFKEAMKRVLEQG